ncbi:MAG: anaerobic carbon-monoxide dehydrogenase catalytic subunit [Chloroflexi bacterium]|jgi:anaerobic carbon-monoxide dehydrogenase catalytic subunit|nr:anaerobic carbon-monoxide dehydrogenase catalytic subunit [Chloroflexota bacterium]MBT4305888.1 anaerobic carbon-monoxide dehydrogenase catalytic subunit [Chloroflexota bacterium]MBT4533713.1 anaerobic carbon-monoxide dehydrogenase catalytic subunit [Chloroflexota bacterium]MBT4681644.1 anaerobic carbon-monoxide dehydrogenase catalytic subunit [Chloroflexota bacterium]MBT4756603.1 anaerobic carbon-monoxide dehydrogenase catalytic subunit [Chloroflexota bacterium]
MPKKRTPQEQSTDPAAHQMLIKAEELGISTAFSRADAMAPCNIGSAGMCCKICGMGPCRLVKDGQVGVCGATIDTIQARNLVRGIAAGSAAHSDHGRDMAFTLKAVANGTAEGYMIRDVAKLRIVAEKYDIPIKDRSPEEIADELADLFISQFGQQRGEVAPTRLAPEKRQKIWREQNVIPRGIDREVVEALHRTHMGDDQDPVHILNHAIRTSLADGWGGSMIATDVSDILFGTPAPLLGSANLGVLKDDMVNVVVHGHEPTLSEMIVAASQDPEIIEYAKKAGAKGVNLAGICCTANEILMRQGVPAAGNFLHQELSIMTGAVEAMVVDVQCIMQALVGLAENFHTKVITTSPKVKLKGATHIEFEEGKALTIAKNILKEAIDNYKNRGDITIPENQEKLVPGFSHEYINYMLGGSYRSSFRPLNDAIMSGRIRGVAAVVGCNNPRSQQDYLHNHVTRELLKQDVLIVETGCGAIAAAKVGLLLGEAGLEQVGPGLREVCETIGIPPVLHMGSCVDNTRILTVLTQMVEDGGLGDDISDIPAVGLAPEWMSEKALAIGTYCVASGAYVIFGGSSPISGMPDKMADSGILSEYISSGWEELYGGKLEFEPDVDELIRKTLEHIDKKRAALGLPVYDADRFGKGGDDRMKELESLSLAERKVALYGVEG